MGFDLCHDTEIYTGQNSDNQWDEKLKWKKIYQASE